jgi:hypothetical protein
MIKHNVSAMFVAAALATLSLPAIGQSDKSAVTTIPVSVGKGPVNAEVLITRYSDLAGSDTNAKSLVDGLRSGSDVTLAGTTIQGTCWVEEKVCKRFPTGQCIPGTEQVVKKEVSCPVVIEPATFSPPTGNMGWGNVELALAFMAAQLTELEIEKPTPGQIKAVLMSGPVDYGTSTPKMRRELPGILMLRAKGMGWPQIAKELGYSLQ